MRRKNSHTMIAAAIKNSGPGIPRTLPARSLVQLEIGAATGCGAMSSETPLRTKNMNNVAMTGGKRRIPTVMPLTILILVPSASTIGIATSGESSEWLPSSLATQETR